MENFISTRAASLCLRLKPHKAKAMSVREALAWPKQGNYLKCHYGNGLLKGLQCISCFNLC